MKNITLMLCMLLSFSNSTSASEDYLVDKISDEVVDGLVETHIKFINNNILAVLCESPHYLAMNYYSSEFKQQLVEDISSTAKSRGVKEYDAKGILEDTQLAFRQFIEGSNYAAYVARKFKIKKGKSYCSSEVMKSIKDSQNKLAGEQSYRLEKNEATANK